MKKFLNMVNYNLWSLVGFQLGFKLLSILIFTPLFLNGFNMIMKITGYHYLTIENIFDFLLNPLTLIMLIILVLLMMIYTMFDITTVIIILDASNQGQKIGISNAVRLSLSKCKKIFRLKNISLAFLVLFLIPFLNFGMTPSFITSINIPEFISDFIIKNPLLFCFFIVIYILLFTMLLRWIYALHYFVLEDISFKEARIKSRNLSHKHHLRDVLNIFKMQILVFLIYIVFIILGILFIILLDKIFYNLIVRSITTTVIWVFIALSFIILRILILPVSYAEISSMFYKLKETKGEEIKHITLNNSKNKSNRWFKVCLTTIILIAIISGTFFTYGLYKGYYNINVEHMRTLEITAHRGSSIKYPENTMLAFIEAKREGANFIELDVQQTKDGKIVVMHDTNLKRTAGVDKNIYDVTYDGIKDLDVGSFLDEKFSSERIPLLENVIIWAKKNNVKLNIELKPTGYEKSFEKQVVDIIMENDFIDQCVVTSQVYDVLKKVKEYQKDITTVYVMSIAYGNITELVYADHFSIEANNITKKMVSNIHKEGKQIYAWTVNTYENINKMIDLNVDNIITDDVNLAKELIYESKTSDLISEYIKLIENLF